MNVQNIKKYAFRLVVAAGLTVIVMSTSQAQDRRRRGGWDRQGQAQQQDQRRRNDCYGQVDRNGNIDRNHNGIDDRYETRDGRVDINQNGIADQDENNGRYGRDRGYNGNGGYYGNRGYGNNNSEFQKGYMDRRSRPTGADL
jgi:hypothetical protein